MTVSFFLLVLASILFRILGLRAGRAFEGRLKALLPRSVMHSHFATLLGEFPDRLPAFRGSALPMQAQALFFNSAACATFLGGLWAFPPEFLGAFDLALLRYSGLFIVLGAFVVDVAAFIKAERLTRA